VTPKRRARRCGLSAARSASTRPDLRASLGSLAKPSMCGSSAVRRSRASCASPCGCCWATESSLIFREMTRTRESLVLPTRQNSPMTDPTLNEQYGIGTERNLRVASKNRFTDRSGNRKLC
jgi:hypothetical protein